MSMTSTVTNTGSVLTPVQGMWTQVQPAVIPPPAAGHGQSIYFNVTAQKPRNFALSFEKAEDGNTAALRNVPVFKAGTFADSMGFVETWTRAHLAQLVANFEMLRPVFTSVPVREDHSRSIKSVVGYVSALRQDGDLLLADFDLTEPRAVEAYERGTYRNRSAEIGYYETNDQAGYWPVFLGVAFVDIPAVEGLFSKATTAHTIRILREAEVTTATTDAAQQTTSAQEESEHEHEERKEQQGQPQQQPPDPGPQTEPDQATEPAPSGQHAVGRAPVVFTIEGRKVADPAEVQRHIDTLERFALEQRHVARDNFVNQLVSENKLAAPQAEAMKAFGRSLSVEQWDAFVESYRDAPSLSVFERHVDATNPSGRGRTAASDLDEEIEIAEAVVAQHRRSGMNQEDLAKSASYQRLQALKAERNK